jgi:hypothetical protein
VKNTIHTFRCKKNEEANGSLLQVQSKQDPAGQLVSCICPRKQPRTPQTDQGEDKTEVELQWTDAAVLLCEHFTRLFQFNMDSPASRRRPHLPPICPSVHPPGQRDMCTALWYTAAHHPLTYFLARLSTRVQPAQDLYQVDPSAADTAQSPPRAWHSETRHARRNLLALGH